jgi:hypothetical protein
MREWPYTIPQDLKEAMEVHAQEDWMTPFRSWAKKHNLRLKIQWFPELERKAAELLQWRWPPGHQDRWMVIREWLVGKDVPPPKQLPREPEIPRPPIGH